MNIILGGTHGLGKEIATELQYQGEETLVTGRSYTEAEHGPGQAIDLASEADAERFADYIYALGEGALSGFYWVSGYGYNGDFAEQKGTSEMAKVNFANVLPIAQAARVRLTEQVVAGNFVVVSSTSGIKARDNEAVYAATKHAQVGFTRSLGLEDERLDVPARVALFLPGGMKTPFWPDDVPKPEGYDTFNDPAKVARAIVGDVLSQSDPYHERIIERGTLV